MPRMMRRAAVLGATAHVASKRRACKGAGTTDTLPRPNHQTPVATSRSRPRLNRLPRLRPPQTTTTI